MGRRAKEGREPPGARARVLPSSGGEGEDAAELARLVREGTLGTHAPFQRPPKPIDLGINHAELSGIYLLVSVPERGSQSH